jgi:hypothetical protein
MDDIVPGLLEAIQSDFERSIKGNKAIERIEKLIEAGTATYKEANDYATWTGQLLSSAITRNVTAATLPDGRMYFNIADRILNDTLKGNHELVATATQKVQESLNRKAGIGIKAVKPELNQDRIDGLVDKISGEADFEKVKWLLDEPIVNFSESIVDSAIKANASLHDKAGLRPVIVRKSTGKCCDWCEEVAGSYEFSDAPDDVFRRHEYCRCMIDYDPGYGKRARLTGTTKRWEEQ